MGMVEETRARQVAYLECDLESCAGEDIDLDALATVAIHDEDGNDGVECLREVVDWAAWYGWYLGPGGSVSRPKHARRREGADRR